MFEGIRINWFLGVLAVELWAAAWFVAFEPEIRRWWRRRLMARRWLHHHPRKPASGASGLVNLQARRRRA